VQRPTDRGVCKTVRSQRSEHATPRRKRAHADDNYGAAGHLDRIAEGVKVLHDGQVHASQTRKTSRYPGRKRLSVLTRNSAGGCDRERNERQAEKRIKGPPETRALAEKRTQASGSGEYHASKTGVIRGKGA